MKSRKKNKKKKTHKNNNNLYDLQTGRTNTLLCRNFSDYHRATDNFEGIWVFNPIKIYTIG